MLKVLATTAAIIAYSGLTFSQDGMESNPYGQPTVEYLKQFVGNGNKTFVYERFNATGVLVQRDVKQLVNPVVVPSATERQINGATYRLRGLRACPEAIVTYQAEQWDCEKAAVDYATAVYGRASIVLCKTLVLKSEEGQQDPVSCFALLGAGNAVEPYTVYNDDDSMVFLGLAGIGTNSEGQSLRPDLAHSKSLGESLQ